MDRSSLVSELLTATEEQLFIDVSTSLYGKAMTPLSKAKAVERGRQWFDMKREALSQAVCQNPAVMRVSRQDVPTHELVVVGCGALDVGVHVLGGAPVVTVAVLIVRLGLHEFCATLWKHDVRQDTSGQV